jgi:hypothetical protein
MLTTEVEQQLDSTLLLFALTHTPLTTVTTTTVTSWVYASKLYEVYGKPPREPVYCGASSGDIGILNGAPGIQAHQVHVSLHYTSF